MLNVSLEIKKKKKENNHDGEHPPFQSGTYRRLDYLIGQALFLKLAKYDKLMLSTKFNAYPIYFSFPFFWLVTHYKAAVIRV